MTAVDAQLDRTERDRQVRRVLWIEGAVNLVIAMTKALVGVSTGALVLIGDAVHSLADLANNAVALVASRIASAPPDRDHPYGHQKFETLAVFGLATLLAILAIEIALRSFDSDKGEVVRLGWGLALMCGVVVTNAILALWEDRQARRLGSELLRADARHTASDILVNLVVIAGWQLAAAGYVWLDGVLTLGVSGLILALAYDLFRRAIPVLVDQAGEDPDALARVVRSVPGVRAASNVRSQRDFAGSRIDVVVTVDPDLSTRESHDIANAIEEVLTARFAARDVTVHIEPDDRSEEDIS
jgi:cation diffusion facilitator family transporter